jgi:hypothetical protein
MSVLDRVRAERCEHCGTALGEISYCERVEAWICMGCFFRLPGEENELGTRNGREELGTRRTSTPTARNLVPSSRSEQGSGGTPSSLEERIVEDLRRLREERRQNPPKAGDPDVVPYALSFAVKRAGAKDKSEAKRAVDALTKAGALVFEYELAKRGKRFGTRCYSLPDRQAA